MTAAALTAADRVEIRDLVARYNVALDARDPDAFAATFTSDGVFDGVLGIFRGHEQLRALVKQLNSAEENQRYARTQHWDDNLTIDGAGDEATLYCHHALLRPVAGGGGEILLMAEYNDIVRRVAGRWLFARRHVRRTDLDSGAAGPRAITSRKGPMHAEDVAQIGLAKAIYARFCDSGHDADGVASLFVEEGVWASEALGVHEGREAIRTFMAGVGNSVVWSRHLLLNPIIEVDPDGQLARAQWLLWCPAVIADPQRGDSSVLIVGNYDDRLVKRDGQWWFQHISVRSLRSTVLPDAWREGLAAG